MKTNYNKTTWLGRLEKPSHEKSKEFEESSLEEMHLGSVLKTLARLEPENEYDLCRDVAKHLLGEVPVPENTDLEP